MKKILIIEDNEKHLQDAKTFFSQIEGISVTFCESYWPFGSTAHHNYPSQWVDLKSYDGVISDIYFPAISGEETHPIGVSIMFQCKMLGIPCVLCTDGYHHGEHYDWISQMWSGLRNDWKDIPKIIDSIDGEDKLDEAGEKGEEVATKGWATAWEELQKYL